MFLKQVKMLKGLLKVENLSLFFPIVTRGKRVFGLVRIFPSLFFLYIYPLNKVTNNSGSFDLARGKIMRASEMKQKEE